MLKVIVATSPFVLAATLVAGGAGQQQAPAASARNPAAITVVGCVVRNGDVDPDKGTRTLDLPAGALALTGARVVAPGGRNGQTSGTVPQESNTGTIPQRTIVDGGGGDSATTTFALTGEAVAKLGDLVGRRVELVGRMVDSAAAAQPRGTTGTPRGAAPVPGIGTREERPAETSAHPSAELKQLEVASFRGVTGGCD
jgi:hypothetical protein